MQFRVLGPPEIYDEVRQRSVQLTSPKQRVLLGVLLVRMGSPVPTEALINELWGRNAPDKAINALQAHVSRLRQQLIEVEPSRANTPRLVARGSGYLLQARPDELDSVQFRLQVARAQRQLESDPQAATLLLRKALKLWRGPALDGGSHGPLCSGVAARLEEERLLALEDLCDASLRLGQHRQVVGQLEELVAAHPLRERFRDQLVLSLQRCGRQGEARAVRDTSRRRRAGEPGPGSAPVRSAHVRQIHDGQRWHTQGVAQHTVAEEFGDTSGAGDLELLRLRRRVDQLTSEQNTLRSEVERLVALVEEGASGQRRDSA
ncbi:BTAD domain-containing putative transcriptional regulator [Streptomyces sp. NPDC020681]|uniref:AfsR/SARP family transcriptional regulator n=1 Tax=Streptomyces sp. NPDC020681 TaxID=3365083 RepID=UPI00379670CE